MKAMTYAQYGGTEVLEQTNRPTPKVAPGAVLIRVKAAAVNPVDWKIMSGGLDGLMDVAFPVTPGWDVAGVVEAVGFDTPEFKVGDEVYSYGRRDTIQGGTFAELVALPAAIVTPKPQTLSWEQAAALPLTGLTAQRTLDALDLRADHVLLVHNGSGSVGRTAIQLAANAGVRVIATGSPANHSRLRELGAEPVAYGDGLVERVRALAPDGVDAAADFIGGVLKDTLALLKEGGRHASIADASVVDHGGQYIWVRPDAAELERLSLLVEDGTLSVDVAQTFPLQEAARAFQESMSGHGTGKIVLTEFTS
ncbi:NADP-dependent oxidoreductase [Arthrobacter sp. H35-D1]|uniref:NADP-dependent oxidoreductase n=1 Tax=Arthrobacter sp. H35-D1 TaxID=3046202 RepID=UPI0024B910D6|nr:NADP-dependent oxidoreductase [Arthrobacter sp. H35-D1]MDJ0311720.1 NADP-dependent oxidoreductase [Arthrobacter sp. H35-D1]